MGQSKIVSAVRHIFINLFILLFLRFVFLLAITTIIFSVNLFKYLIYDIEGYLPVFHKNKIENLEERNDIRWVPALSVCLTICIHILKCDLIYLMYRIPAHNTHKHTFTTSAISPCLYNIIYFSIIVSIHFSHNFDTPNYVLK